MKELIYPFLLATIFLANDTLYRVAYTQNAKDIGLLARNPLKYLLNLALVFIQLAAIYFMSPTIFEIPSEAQTFVGNAVGVLFAFNFIVAPITDKNFGERNAFRAAMTTAAIAFYLEITQASNQ